MFSYIKLALFVATIGAIGSAYAYHTITVAEFKADVAKLEANNHILKENNVSLMEAAENNAAKVLELETQRDEEHLAVVNLTIKTQELEEDRKKFMRIFKDHNLTRLARAKPGLIETRINNATDAVFKQVEDHSKEIQDADM
jgi:peptidoglycan hydrolase CwlO-like protein